MQNTLRRRFEFLLLLKLIHTLKNINELTVWESGHLLAYLNDSFCCVMAGLHTLPLEGEYHV